MDGNSIIGSAPMDTPVQGQPMAVTPGTMPAVGVNPLMKAEPVKEHNHIGFIIGLVGAGILAVVGLVLSLVFFLQWDEAQTNVDGKIDEAVAIAVEEQRLIDEENFREREKLPNLDFLGPADYGSLSFKYPKTWNLYVEDDASDGNDFIAYLNPGQVNPVEDGMINALRVNIYDQPIEDIRQDYMSLVEDGMLQASVFQVGDVTGDRYDGTFDDDVVGSAVMMKVNDKTVVLRTDAAIFRPDFDQLITTISFD